MLKSKYISFLVSILLFWRLWLPGTRVAFDYPYWYPEVTKSFLSLPMLWRDVAGVDGLGQFVLSTFFIEPVLLAIGLFSNLGVSFDLITRLLVLLALLLGSWGMDKLLEYYKLSFWARIAGTLFFLTNSYILLLFDGGQLYLALAYSALPLAYYLFLHSADNKKVSYSSFLFALIISIFDLRIFVLLCFLEVVKLVFDLFPPNKKDVLRFYSSHFAVSILLLLGIHAFWLLPLIASGSTGLSGTYGLIQQLESFSFSSLSHSLYFQEPHWYKNIFGKVMEVSWQFSFIPIVVFVSSLVRPKNKNVAYWIIVSLFSLFLSKGTQEPFGGFYTFLYQYLPGFTFFRDPSKFYFIQALGYSVLAAYTLDGLARLKLPLFKINAAKLIPPTVIIYFLCLAWPVYTNQMTGLFSNPRFQNEFNTTNEIIKSDSSFSRVLWIPKMQPLGYANDQHPAVEATYLSEKRPFSSGILGTYETLNFLREAPYVGELLKVAGIKYLVFPPLDPRRDDMKQENVDYYYQFIEQIKRQPWIQESVNSQIPILKTKQTSPRLFMASNLWWVIGSDAIYNDAYRHSLDFQANAFVFPEENLKIGARLEEFPQAKIVLYKKTILDFVMSMQGSARYVYPAEKLSQAPDQTGWWMRTTTDAAGWKNFLLEKYQVSNQDFDLGGGWAISEGEHSLDVSLNSQERDVLLARALESTRSGEIAVSDNGKPIANINTYSAGDTFQWSQLGELPAGQHVITLKTKGEINVINALALINKNEINKYSEIANNLQHDGRIQELGPVEQITPAKVQYERKDPAHYTVSVSGINSPQLLIFSENYNQNWQLNGKPPIPVYSLLNGYLVDANGNYELVFTPQNYVIPGAVISIATCICLLTALVYGIKIKR